MIDEVLVSIIMPTYNRAYCLDNAVGSIQQQTYKNWELIIVDDNSSDNTEVKIQEYQVLDDRIIYKKLRQNVGASEARNVGMKMATGHYITFLDSDDEYLKFKIEKQINFFFTSKLKNLGIVSCGAVDFVKGKEYNRRLPIKRKNYYKSLLAKRKRIGAGTPFLMIKSNLVKQDHIFFDKEMPAMQDWDFVLRVVKRYNFGFVNDYLVKVNHHDNERVYTSKNAVKALYLQYGKYEKWLLDEPWSHKKFVINASILIAHHDSIEKAQVLLNSSILRFNSPYDRFELFFFKNVLNLFHFNLFKMFYLKFFK